MALEFVTIKVRNELRGSAESKQKLRRLLKLTEIVRHFSSIKKSDVLCRECDMFPCRNESVDVRSDF